MAWPTGNKQPTMVCQERNEPQTDAHLPPYFVWVADFIETTICCTRWEKYDFPPPPMELNQKLRVY